jgi:tetratricopeptide (TPR) repeat protein
LEGNRFLREGKPDMAVIMYTFALSWDTTCTEALLKRGLARESLGMHYEALGDYDRAFSKDNQLVEALWGGADLRMRLLEQACDETKDSGEHTLLKLKIASLEALLDRDLARWIKVKSTDPEAYDLRGRLRFIQKRYEEAAHDFTLMLLMDPFNAWCYNQRGRCQHELGDFEKAVADYSKAIRLDSENGGVFFNRGLAFERMDRLGDAEQDFTQAIRCDSTDAWAFYRRGTLRIERGAAVDGNQDLLKAIQLGVPPEIVGPTQ